MYSKWRVPWQAVGKACSPRFGLSGPFALSGQSPFAPDPGHKWLFVKSGKEG